MSNNDKRYMIIGKLNEQIAKYGDSEELIPFLEQLTNLLENIEKSNDTNLNDIADVFSKLNQIILEIDEEPEEVKISEEQKMPSSEGNDTFIDEEAILVEKTVEDKIELKEHGWCAHFYSYKGLLSFFGTELMPPHHKYLFRISEHRDFVMFEYVEEIKQYRLGYCPETFENRQTKDGPLCRNGNPYFVLHLSNEEIEKIALKEDTEIFLKDGVLLNDAIYSSSLNSGQKCLLPFYTKNTPVEEFDIEFAKIFIKIFAIVRNDLAHKDRGFLEKITGKEDTLISIKNNNNPLNLQDMFKLTKIFNKSGHEDIKFFMNDFCNDNVYRDERNMTYPHPLRLNSFGGSVDEWHKIYEFDIKNGFSSVENIERLLGYIAEEYMKINGVIENFNSKVERWVRIKPQNGAPWTDELKAKAEYNLKMAKQERRMQQPLYEFYQPFLKEMYLQLLDLYKRKFGTTFENESNKIFSGEEEYYDYEQAQVDYNYANESSQISYEQNLGYGHNNHKR